MIEEQGRIVAIEDEFAWIETERRTSCGSCAANKGCGTHVLGKVLGAKRSRVKVLNTVSAAVGDDVIIGVAEQALLKGSFAIYIVPLLMLFIFAVAGDVLMRSLFGGGNDLVTSLCGLIGLMAGLGWQRHFGRKVRSDERYTPVIVRIGRVAGGL